jgi:probable HAF family extracellular repeat protein
METNIGKNEAIGAIFIGASISTIVCGCGHRAAPHSRSPLASMSTAGPVQSYGVVYLVNALGGATTYHGAGGINDLGEVVGGAYTPKGVMRPYLWDGSMRDLGTLPGDSVGCGYALNNKGVVVGTSGGANGDRGVVWRDGRIQPLETLPGFHAVWPRSVNDNGDIVGVAYNSGKDDYSRPSTAVLWHDGLIQNLGCLPGCRNGHAIAINSAGQIAGWTIDTAGHTRAVLWDHGHIVDLGAQAKCAISMAYAIDSRGNIVGDGGYDAKSMRGMMWSPNGNVHRYGTLTYADYSKATAINGAGVIAGNRKLAAGETSSFVLDPRFGMRDVMTLIPSPSTYLPLHVFGINKLGQVLAWGDYRAMSEQTYVLTPSSLAVKQDTTTGNLLQPSDDISNWRLVLQPGADASMSVDHGAVKIDVKKVDGTDWHVTCMQRGVALVDGKRYTLSFRARADQPRSIHVSGIFQLPDYHNIGLDRAFDFAREWHTYSTTFTAKKVVARESCVPNFVLGGQAGTVWVNSTSLVANGDRSRREFGAVN